MGYKKVVFGMLKFRSYKIGESRREKIILGHKKTLILFTKTTTGVSEKHIKKYVAQNEANGQTP